MGNDEAIIYGDRHGEQYREDGDKTESAWKSYYPNAVKLNSIGGHEVSIGVITFDQETGERNVTEYDQDGEPLEQWDSLWTSLDRQGVNRLIRELRSMRDRVFGKDE